MSMTVSPIQTAASAGPRDRKASVSVTPHYITQGLTAHTVSTPDEIPAVPTPGSGLGSYFNLSRQPSTGSSRPLSRRPSLTLSSSNSAAQPTISDPVFSSAASTFSLKLAPRTPGASSASKMFARTNTGAIPPSLPPMGAIPAGPTSPSGLYVTLHETCTKRIATLDYLRRAHEGRVYFFNVMLTPRGDLQRTVYPDPKKLVKKAINFFTLGNSLPSILDGGITTPMDYLKAFNILLQEYETYIALPPSRQTASRAHSSSISLGSGSGSGSSSGSSALRSIGLPKFFSRSGHHHHSSKQRRGSTATQASAPDPLGLERTRSSSNSSGSGGGGGGGPIISAPTMVNEDTVPPLSMSLSAATLSSVAGEEYVYLTTPALPFDPDYFETFASLCDVLIDVYSRVTSLVNEPKFCPPSICEAFLKADAKIRRIVISGTVREWEDAVRLGVKREVGGVAREVLGGML